MFDYGADLQNAYDEGYKKGKADAVRHGRWKYTHILDSRGRVVGNLFECTACNYQLKRNIGGKATNYCPNCGTKMDEEKNDA